MNVATRGPLVDGQTVRMPMRMTTKGQCDATMTERDIETYGMKSVVALSLVDPLAGATRGKSGQHRVPYFLTGRDAMPQGLRHSKCHRNHTANVDHRHGKGASARQELTTVFSDDIDGKPYGLKDQIYRQSRVDSPLPGGRLIETVGDGCPRLMIEVPLRRDTEPGLHATDFFFFFCLSKTNAERHANRSCL